jgi:hypothetical protein
MQEFLQNVDTGIYVLVALWTSSPAVVWTTTLIGRAHDTSQAAAFVTHAPFLCVCKLPLALDMCMGLAFGAVTRVLTAPTLVETTLLRQSPPLHGFFDPHVPS